MKYKAKRIYRGKYLYRGVIIYSCGYHSPDQKVVWEAECPKEGVVAHGFSLKEAKMFVDDYKNELEA